MEANPFIYIPETWRTWSVQADRECLCIKQKDRFAKVLMADLLYCTVSCDMEYLFILTTRDHKVLRFTVGKKPQYAKKLFAILDGFCDGFRSIAATCTPRSWTCGNYHYRVDRNELVVEFPRLFSREMKVLYRIPTADMAVCTQRHNEHDTEAPDCYELRLYTASGKYYDLPGDGVEQCYEAAKMLKENAPQLRYGLDTFTGFSGVVKGAP